MTPAEKTKIEGKPRRQAVMPGNAPGRDRYHEATGGRKTAKARVYLFAEGTGIAVNDRDYRIYFRLPKHQAEIIAPLDVAKLADRVRVSVHVKGGGIHAQAQATRNAIAKAIVLFDPESKKRLRRMGYLTRDARMVERKKYGLKKARRAPQWSKR